MDLYIDGSVDFAPNLLNWMKKIRNKERYKYLRFDFTIGHLEKVNETGIYFVKIVSGNVISTKKIMIEN